MQRCSRTNARIIEAQSDDLCRGRTLSALGHGFRDRRVWTVRWPRHRSGQRTQVLQFGPVKWLRPQGLASGHALAASRQQDRVRRGYAVCLDEAMDLPRPFVIRESTHRIHDPLTPAKLARLGEALLLRPGQYVLDLACGSGEMLCTWARDHDITGAGVDVSSAFIDRARARASELGVGDRVRFEHGDAAAMLPPSRLTSLRASGLPGSATGSSARSIC
jgi:SAM-dependent methyltransferase